MRNILFLIPLFCACSLPDLRSPVTEMTVSPINKTIKFRDTKDNRLEVTDLKAKTKDGGAFEVGHLVIENQSSSVIAQQLTLMQEYSNQMKIANEGLKEMWDTVRMYRDAIVDMVKKNENTNTLTPLPLPPIPNSP